MTRAREALFELAVARGLAYAQGLGLALGDPEALRRGLELWYLKTRFAYRVPLEEVVAALLRYPGSGRWRGGPDGGWKTDVPNTPGGRSALD